MPTSGAGCQLLERSRRRFELTPNPRHLKYESYSKPEAPHFRLRTCLDTLTFDLILVKLDQKQEFLIHEKLCTPL